MITTISSSTGLSGKGLLKKGLLFCGIISSLFYVAINIIVPTQYEGYSIASQTVSELSAVGAATRSLWVSLAIVYTVFVVAFGWGIWISAEEKRTLRIAGGLMIAYATFGLFWPPMHQREVLAAGGGTLTDTLHIVWTMVTAIMMMLVIWLGGAAMGNRFRFYSVVTIITLLGFGVLTALESPQMQANLPSPWIGVWERICMGAFMLWVLVFAIALLLRERIDITNTGIDNHN